MRIFIPALTFVLAACSSCAADPSPGDACSVYEPDEYLRPGTIGAAGECVATAPAELTAPACPAPPLVCADALSGDYLADELPPASGALFTALASCACATPTWSGGPAPVLGPCASACRVWIPDDGAFACGLANSDAASPACDACIASTCASELAACVDDAPPGPPCAPPCMSDTDCAMGQYCEIGAGAVASSYTLDHTCQPVATLIASAPSCTTPAKATAADVPVTYTSDGWKCHVRQPSSGMGLPVALVLTYGGFLQQFAQNADVIEYAQQLVTSGKVAIVCDYTKATTTISGVPSELSDARCAIRTAGTSALASAFVAAGGGTYRGDPSRLGVVGSSAGGSLALVAALTADWSALPVGAGTVALDSGTCLAGAGSIVGLVKALVAAAPPTDLPGPYGYGSAAYPTKATGLDKYAGTSIDPARSDALAAVSPALADMAHPYPGAPPVLLVQSSGDLTVDPSQTASMDAALAAHGFAHRRVVTGTYLCGAVNCSHPFPLNRLADAGNCASWALLGSL